MKCKLQTLTTLVVILGFFSCSKNDTKEDPTGMAPVTGNLYFSGCKGLYCFDLNTGNIAWTASVNMGNEGTPIYDKGNLYISDPYGSYAFDAQTGKNKWKRFYSFFNGAYSGECKAYLTPVITDTVMYTMGFDGPNFDVLLYAINKNNGDVLWSKFLTDWVRTDVAQLRLIDKKLIVLTKQNMMAVKCETGEEVWNKELLSQNIVPDMHMRESGSLLYFYDNNEKKIVTVEPNNGNIVSRIAVPADFEPASLIVQDNYIYGTSKVNSNPNVISGRYYVIDKITGTVVNAQLLNPDQSYNESFSTGFNKYFFFDISLDSSGIFLYNPFYLMSFSQNSFAQQWKQKLPLQKMIDSVGYPTSAGTVDIIESGPVVAAGTYTAQISEFKRVGPGGVNEMYMNVDVVDMKTGSLVKSVPFRFLDCFGVPNHYIIVDDGKAYYSKFDW